MFLALCTKVTQGLSLDESIAIAVRYGFSGIEIFGLPEHLPPDTPKEEVVRYADVITDAGLRVSCLATYVGPYHDADDQKRQELLSQLRGYCRFADLLGCNLIRQGTAYKAPNQLSEEEWQRTADGLRAAADVAAEYEKRIVLETHDGQVVETPQATLRLLEMIDRENVGITFDPANHVTHLDEWLEAVAGPLAERVWNVHVKDTTVDRQQRLFGQGDVNYGGVWQALAQAGYDGPIGVECHAQRTDEWPAERIVEHEIQAVRNSLLASPLAARLQN
ncbi:MAG: sugar phosphate isomerase/epimerase [Armatimonadetes bacterium]|nr:sugar phosphate isomerase/epimerase [Armatimonadota bacterium]